MRLMDEILETECGVEKHDALMSMKVSWADEPCAIKSFDELHRWTVKVLLEGRSWAWTRDSPSISLSPAAPR